TGAVGRLLTRHLVADLGVRHLVLLSRRGEAPEQVAELTELGAEVTLTACDVADREALAAVLDAIPAEHPLTSVVHMPVVVDDATVANLTPDKLAAALRPKVDGALALHELTQHHPVKAFVMFS